METKSNSTIGNLVNEIINDRKKSNLILEIEDQLLSEDDKIANIQACQTLFVHFLEKREMFSSVESHHIKSAQEKYKEWLRLRYKSFVDHLLTLLHHEDSEIQSCALDALMLLVTTEAEYTMKPTQVKAYPYESFQMIVENLVDQIEDTTPLIQHFQTYMKQDVQLYILKSVYVILGNVKRKTHFFSNTFALLTKIRHPKQLLSCLDNISSKEGNEEPTVKANVFNKAFSQTWMLFTKQKLPKAVFKKLLLFLPQRVLPYLKEPLLLTDLFSDSYCQGGIISLLSLNGIFYLIQNHNLEYPDFFKRLYSLFNGEVVTSRYRARFFFLADIFLSSTHLPAYLVAALVKRLARLSLVVPPNIVLIILPFIGNLLIRHPSLRILVHNPCVSDDPYVYEAEDPAQSNALKSSLWEIKALQNHWNPQVSKKAKLIDLDSPRAEWDISNLLELLIDDMVKKEIKSVPNEIHMSYDEPKGFFQRNEDAMNDLWTL